MAVLYLIVILISVLLLFIYYNVTKNYDYWKKRNVPHLKPTFLFGNYKDFVLFKKFNATVAKEICEQFPKEPYIGSYYGTDPALIVKDPDLLKLIMAKDFYYFNSREVSEHTHKELITQNMFFNDGDDWKVLRQNLTALFSSAKIKGMFHLIESCATTLEKVLENEMGDDKIVEVKSLLARYTMDCIGTCAFGVNTGTLEKKSTTNPFYIMGQKLFDVSNYGGFRFVGRTLWPNIFYKLGFTMFDKQIQVFFKKLMKQVFESRQYKESSKNDFVDLVLGWKKKAYLTGDKITNMKTKEKDTINLEINDDLLIAQCILFFAAGFETTSTTTSFMLYELAKNQEAQSRVIKEIDEYYERHNGKIQYEAINEMTYLQACIDETLRLYPVLAIITREVVEDYTLPTGLQLDKGTRIHIPVYHIQRSEEYFAKPEEFRPERFYGEEKQNIRPFTHIPFGEGPRLCIGMRFSKMPITAGVLTVLKNYRVELAEGMPQKISEFNPRTFITQPLTDINLKFIPRKTNTY